MKTWSIIFAVVLLSACGTTRIVEIQQINIQQSDICCGEGVIQGPVIIQESTEATIYPY